VVTPVTGHGTCAKIRAGSEYSNWLDMSYTTLPATASFRCRGHSDEEGRGQASATLRILRRQKGRTLSMRAAVRKRRTARARALAPSAEIHGHASDRQALRAARLVARPGVPDRARRSWGPSIGPADHRRA
jgi:hypothetical protein